ncbi:tetratricopeptide repeat-containing sensor histidine kinase [Parachryseolinea silvisoli]|uniref:tetratricopeptide repeat-containing sensor histidine kinase n=1 Tax=Parachryseolinea silvisoli TaxID=2873601 RepID=UPI002265F324|nr:histidine kinase dimerization/phosphoacceptor domain -containing protein [Parachryseolinea silvisoli]MCD9017687.1 hypothetical protein [Parachryseolinea silvisoli]
MTGKFYGQLAANLFTLFLVLCGIVPCHAGDELPPAVLLNKLGKTTGVAARIEILVDLADYYIDTEWDYSNNAKVDSALIYLREARVLTQKRPYDSLTNTVFITLGKYYYRADNFAAAYQTFMLAVSLAREAADKNLEARAWLTFAGRTPLIDSLRSKKLQRYKRSIELFKSVGNKKMQLYVTQRLVGDYLEQGMFQEAEAPLKELVILHEQYHFKNAYRTYFQYGKLEASRGNYSKAIEYAHRALQDSTGEDGLFYKSEVNYTLSVWYSELNLHPQAVKHSKLALALFRKIEYPDNHQRFFSYAVLRQVARGLISQHMPQQALDFVLATDRQLSPASKLGKHLFFGALADCYTALGDYGLAETFYLKAIHQASSNGRLVDLRNEYFTIAKLYIQKKQFKKAEMNVQQYLTIGPEKDALKLRDIYRMRFRIDSASGHYPSAIRYLSMSHQVSDSIFSERNTKYIRELEMRHETARDRQQIALLQKEKKLQEATVRAAEVSKRITLAGAALLAAITVLLLRAYHSKQRSIREMQSKQEEINDANVYLKKLIQEKEWLIKEMHHRVKNNLHTVMSLLESQAAYLGNSREKNVIRESRHRVQAMTLLHQKLYINGDLDTIDMFDFVTELIAYLVDSFDLEERVVFHVDVDRVSFEVGHAVTLALILNELITNALKYAFPDECPGGVRVSLSSQPNNTYTLAIKDNGVGLPEHFDLATHASLGLTLVRGFTDDISGKLKITTGPGGVEVRIDFVYVFNPPIKSTR